MSEAKTFLFLSIFILSISTFPYLYGVIITPPEHQFMGVIGSIEDTQSYLAWMKQAYDGAWFFEDKFTPEEHPANIFLPLWLILGRLARVSGLSLIMVYHLARLIFGFTLLSAIYLFLKHSLLDPRLRRIAFLLICVSSGWGAILLTAYQIGFHFLEPLLLLDPVDLWMPEAITFWSLYWSPLFSISITIMLLIFILFLASVDQITWRNPQSAIRSMACVLLAGILGFFLVLTHPYDIVTVWTVVGLFSLITFLYDQDKRKKIVISSLIFFSLSGLGIVWEWWTMRGNFLIQEWSKIPTISFNPVGYILGLGLPLMIAPIGVPFTLKKGTPLARLGLIWILVVPFLVYGPFNFQRRLIQGVHIPICIMATLGLFQILTWIEPYFNRRLLVRAFILLTIPSNLYRFGADFMELKANKHMEYLPLQTLEALAWLNKTAFPHETIFSSGKMGIFIPTQTGSRTFLGQWSQTLWVKEKKELVERFFSSQTDDGFRRKLLKVYRVHYLFYGPEERKLGGFNPEGKDYLEKRFENKSVSVYEIRRNLGR
ncbi:MAG: hypothetical protein AB1797_07680 [bacterium]